jgi:uncharacterized protein (DUF58 family)
MTWTRNAKMLAAISAAFYVVALVNDAFAAYVLFWASACLLAAGYVYARRSLRGVSIARRLAGNRIFHNEPLPLILALRHPPGCSRAFIIRDPVHSLTQETTETHEYVLQAEPEASEDELKHSLDFPLRGHYRLGPLVLQGSDAVGLFTRSVEAGRAAEVLVYPRPLPLPKVYLRGLSSYRLSELRTAPLAGATQEFYGIRPYQYGDDLRRIHWKSTARTGRLAIKEYEHRVSTAATIVLDLHRQAHRGSGAQSTLEYAVTIAASLARHVVDSGNSLSLISTGAERFLLPMERGEHQLHKALEHLAVVKADGTADFASALGTRLGEIPAACTVFVITPSADAHLAYPLLMLRGVGAHVTAVLIAAHTFAEAADPRAEAAYGNLLTAAFGAANAVCPVRRGDDIASSLGAARLWL